MTRSSDKYVTLLKRSQLAEQLEADLFISIHVNSHSIANKNISGIETFYLHSKQFIPPNSDSGFLCINGKAQQQHINTVQNMVRNNTKASQLLAQNIQKNIINYLEQKKYPTPCRGTKQSRDRVLLRSYVPAALVEVGFITNKREATMLSKDSYQWIIANGIFTGIKKTLHFLK